MTHTEITITLQNLEESACFQDAQIGKKMSLK